MFGKKRFYTINPEDVFTDSLRNKSSAFGEYEGVMDLPVSKWSAVFVGFIAFAFTCLFLYKAYGLQVLDYDELNKKAFKNNFASQPILAIRGSIVDRYGEVLAHTEKASSTDEIYSRVYTDKPGFGNVLGFVSYPQKDTSGNFWQNSFKGVAGIEEYYDQLLAGSVGEKLFEKSANGKLGEGFVFSQPINGKNVQLSIDADMQEKMYKELEFFLKKNGYEGGVGLIMNAKTGEMLTLVTYPTYEPRLLMPDSKATPTRAEYYKSLESDPLKPFINRAIAGVYTPGSIVKPLFGLIALDSGVIDAATSIFSNGQIEVPNPYTGKATIFRDWRASGWTNVAEAIAVSSDVFFYSVVGGYEGQKGVGIDAIDRYAQAFHFDDKTGIDLSGEKTGMIPTPKWKEDTFGEPWRLGDTYNSSIGQYGFTVTPIGIARVLSGIVNDGRLVQPRVLKLQPNDPNSLEQVSVSISSQWYNLVKSGMRMAVTNGTASNLNMPYVNVAAKTGTAEIGTTKSKVHMWITGFFPYENPKYIFVMIAEKGRRGDSPNPSLVMNRLFDWMRVHRPEYLGFSEERIAREKRERESVYVTPAATTSIQTDTSSTTQSTSTSQIGESLPD
jgi:penicillin-binding protein 2